MTLKTYIASIVFGTAFFGVLALAASTASIARAQETPTASAENTDAPAAPTNSASNQDQVADPVVPTNSQANTDTTPDPIIPSNGGANTDTTPDPLIPSGQGSNSGVDDTSAPVTPGNPGTTDTSGGGSSGSSFSGGSGGGAFFPTATTTATTTSPALPVLINIAQCTSYITDYLKFGIANNPVQVTRLQQFLATEGFRVPVTGFFGRDTEAAVDAFQEKYLAEIMLPWGATRGSGFVYITTTKKINELYCKANFSLTAAQIAVIEAYRTNQANGSTADPLFPGITASSTASTTAVIGQGSSTDSAANTAAAVNTGIFSRIWNFIKGLFGR